MAARLFPMFATRAGWPRIGGHHSEPPRTIRLRRRERREAVRAARGDLRGQSLLQRPAGYQRALVSNYRAGRAARLERLEAESGALKMERVEIPQEVDARERDREKAEKGSTQLGAELAQLPDPGPIGRMRTGRFRTLLLLLAAVDVPLVYLALGPLPAPEIVRWTIAVALGGFFVGFAHYLGAVAERLVHDEGETIEGKRDWYAHVATLVIGCVVIVGFVAFFAVVRGDEIVKASELARFLNLTPDDASGVSVETGFRHPVVLGIAFAFWHAATLLLAFYLGFARAKGAGWRRVADELEDEQSRLQQAEDRLLELRKRGEAIEEQLAVLERRTYYDIEQLLRLHEGKEAYYLTILTRGTAEPPDPVAAWDDGSEPDSSGNGRASVPIVSIRRGVDGPAREEAR